MQTANQTAFRVMLVEDDLQQQQSVLAALKEQSNALIVEAFSDYDSAKKQLENQTPDLLISDIMLGSHRDGGFELARVLQKQSKPVPIIFFSERQSEYDIMAGHDLGAVDYLPMPLSLAVLQKNEGNLLR